ncbi:oxidoreductase [[Pantoea] beijingensis]|uniref:Oxidoreductase n=1 Tax=[Pantoea] beijingensis TaxID=1324864 RepID=A0A443IEK5_9GAMM|nr:MULTISPECIES: Gfo/Idh/MocA family oxidoreductase [Erwiniaceae]RWR02492.1 oxidoreductase [[Pantoea] beijingensis]
MSKRLRLGMVGGGEGAFIGAVHRIAARLDDEYELVAGAFSSSPEVGQRSGATLHIAPERCYRDFWQMAQQESARDEGIDVVAIVTPNHLHVPVALAFLQQGIHVICDKPLCISLEEARQLAEVVSAGEVHFILTHNYSGLPLIREARERVLRGELGEIRSVEVEYLQDWMSERVELTDNKQARWRGDPALSGFGCIGDIGTHAWQLARFVSGMEPEAIRCEMLTRVAGRKLDDEIFVDMRYHGGARGRLWASQVAAGHENDLRLRIYGSEASLTFHQTHPNELWIQSRQSSAKRITRNNGDCGESSRRVCRTPAGHPEGYLEGFAQIYREAAIAIRGGDAPLLPGIDDGLSGMRFIETAQQSSLQGGLWRPLIAF